MYDEIIKNYFREFVFKDKSDLYLSQMAMGRFNLTILHNPDSLDLCPAYKKLINDIIEILQVIMESFKGTYYLAFKGPKDDGVYINKYYKIKGEIVTIISEVSYYSFFDIPPHKNIF